jgi:hypothetical protein
MGKVEFAELYTVNFVNAALHCITDSRRAIEILEFGQCRPLDDDTLGWTDLLVWRKLDLTGLKQLKVDPWPQNYLPINRPSRRRLLQRDIRHLLDRAAGTLESFDCQRAYDLSWHDSPPRLPRLRRLALGNCSITSAFFCGWLKVLPNLEYIKLDRLELADEEDVEEPDENWKVIFDAL